MPETTTARPRRSRRRLILLVLFLSPLALIVGLWGWIEYSTASRLRRALAEADRLDPGWRMGQIEARRERPPSDRNSALQVRAVLDRLPPDWLGVRTTSQPADGEAEGPLRGNALLYALAAHDPATPLPEPISTGIDAELAAAGPAVDEARKLADMPAGRYTVQWDPSYINTRLQHAQDARQVARLLELDALRRARDGDPDGALASCRACLNVGRSLGDEPTLISQLVRMAIESVSLGAIERVLAMPGAASDEALATTESALAEEAAEPLVLYGLRGERAGMYELLNAISEGRVNPSAVGIGGGAGLMRVPWPGFHAHNQALLLERLNEGVEIARRPVAEQARLWEQWDLASAMPNDLPSRLRGALAYMLVPAMKSAGDAYVRTRAQLDCGRTLILLERYRLRHGDWPASAEAIAGDLPTDPYASRPIRYVRRDDGLTVYSVGPDGKDDGGKLDPHGRPQPGTDLGFRLWDPDRRGKAAEGD